MSRESTSRKELWVELDQLCDQARVGGFGSLPLHSILRAAALYRAASRDLALARGERAEPDQIAYLNRLVTRAHSQVYRIRPERRESVLGFFTDGFPGAFRRHSAAIALTGLFFLLVMVASYSAVALRPELAEQLFYKDMIEFESYRLEREAGTYKGNFTFSPEISPLFSAMIIVNNVRVALLMFAAGIIFGLITLYMLFFNGLMVGVLVALTVQYGHGFNFVSLIATHGVVELFALVVAAAGGLLMGWTLVRSDELPRRYRLRLIAPDACRLLGGAAMLLVFAGLIEGFITPHFEAGVRLATAAGSGLLVFTYLAGCGWARRGAGSSSN